MRRELPVDLSWRANRKGGASGVPPFHESPGRLALPALTALLAALTALALIRLPALRSSPALTLTGLPALALTALPTLILLALLLPSILAARLVLIAVLVALLIVIRHRELLSCRNFCVEETEADGVCSNGTNA